MKLFRKLKKLEHRHKVKAVVSAGVLSVSAAALLIPEATAAIVAGSVLTNLFWIWEE